MEALCSLKLSTLEACSGNPPNEERPAPHWRSASHHSKVSLLQRLPLACDFATLRISLDELQAMLLMHLLLCLPLLSCVSLSYQRRGARLVASTYSPHMQTSPPITSFFCPSVPVKGQHKLCFNYTTWFILNTQNLYTILFFTQIHDTPSHN